MKTPAIIFTDDTTGGACIYQQRTSPPASLTFSTIPVETEICTNRTDPLLEKVDCIQPYRSLHHCIKYIII